MNGDEKIAYLNRIMEDKGYGGCNIKLEWIRGRPFAIMYMFKPAYVELFTQKVNMELGLELAQVKTDYTNGVKGLNITKIFDRLVESINDISNANEPINEERIFSLEAVYNYCIKEYKFNVDRARNILNFENKYDVVIYCNALHKMGLYETPDHRFYVPLEVGL